MKVYIVTTHPKLGSKRSEFLGTVEQAKVWIEQAQKRTNFLTFTIEMGTGR